MPRLPTILVIGSQAMSTSWPGSRLAVVGSGTIVVIGFSPFEMEIGIPRPTRYSPGSAGSGGELVARVAPARLLVDGALRDTPQVADHGPVQTHRGARQLAARRLVHERHELVREARHG